MRGIDLYLHIRALVCHEVRAILPIVGITLLYPFEFPERPAWPNLTDFAHLGANRGPLVLPLRNLPIDTMEVSVETELSYLADNDRPIASHSRVYIDPANRVLICKRDARRYQHGDGEGGCKSKCCDDCHQGQSVASELCDSSDHRVSHSFWFPRRCSKIYQRHGYRLQCVCQASG